MSNRGYDRGMEEPITFRDAAAQDAETLTEIAMTAKAHWGYDADFLAIARKELTVTAQRIAEEDMQLACLAGTPVGYISLVPGDEAGEGEIENLFVLPTAMGRNLGARLVDWAIARAASKGWGRLWVESDPNAQGFYERVGFELCGRSPSGSIPGRFLPRLKRTIT